MIPFLFSIWIAAHYLFQLINSFRVTIPVGTFDGALRLLEGLYMANGFIPYKDFSFVYPPGQILLNSTIKQNITSTIQLYTILSALISIPLILFIYNKTKSFFISGVICLLLSINFQPLTSPYTTALFLWLATLIYFYLIDGAKRSLWGIFVTCTVFIFLKWDNAVILTILLAFELLVAKIFSITFSKKDIFRFFELIKTLVYSICFSFISLIAYLSILQSDVKNALYFIFIVPIKISPYRHLSLFSAANIAHGKIIYFFLLLLLFLAFYFVRTLKNDKLKIHDLFLVSLPFSTLPYALGRSDIPHALPLITSIMFVFCIYSYNKKFIFTILLSLASIYSLHNFNMLAIPKINAEIDPISSISSCEKLASNVSYQTIFVGRDNYSRYVTSTSSLYLVDPSKKPATEYLSDEPGLQNTCYDGSKIAGELSESRKPMLAFIETSKQTLEPNLSSSMNSCNYIENWLKSHKYTVVNNCTVGKSKFEIRIYNK